MTKYNLERTGALIRQLDLGMKAARCDYRFRLYMSAYYAGMSLYGASVWAVKDRGIFGFLTAVMLCSLFASFSFAIKPHRVYCRARELRKHVLAADAAQTRSTLDHHMEQSEAAFDRLMKS